MIDLKLIETLKDTRGGFDSLETYQVILDNKPTNLTMFIQRDRIDRYELQSPDIPDEQLEGLYHTKQQALNAARQIVQKRMNRNANLSR